MGKAVRTVRDRHSAQADLDPVRRRSRPARLAVSAAAAGSCSGPARRLPARAPSARLSCFSEGASTRSTIEGEGTAGPRARAGSRAKSALQTLRLERVGEMPGPTSTMATRGQDGTRVVVWPNSTIGPRTVDTPTNITSRSTESKIFAGTSSFDRLVDRISRGALQSRVGPGLRLGPSGAERPARPTRARGLSRGHGC